MRVCFFLGLILIFSCEKEIILELEDQDPKLVVNCLFEPDTNFRVFVAYSEPIDSKEPEVINEASVYLQKDGSLIDTLFSEGDGWYSSSYYPQYGANYSIGVSYNSDSVYASSYVPLPISYYMGTYELINDQSQNSTNPHYEIKYTYVFHDGAEEQYYQILEGNFLQTPQNYTHISDPSILNDSEIQYNPGSLFFSDDLFNGDTTEIVANIIHLGGIGGVPGPFNGTIKSLSSNYYHFIKSWVRHRFNQNTSTNIDDPFTLVFQGEPSELYSNIVGGYGIFAGYNSIESTFIYIP